MKKALMIKNKNSSNSMIPIIIYKDIKNQKSIILKDNKNKAGIYRWINLINSKTKQQPVNYNNSQNIVIEI